MNINYSQYQAKIQVAARAGDHCQPETRTPDIGTAVRPGLNPARFAPDSGLRPPPSIQGLIQLLRLKAEAC